MSKINKGERAVSKQAGDEKKTFREQLGALKNLPKFFRLIWSTSKGMTVSNMLLRLVKASLPLALLYIGKLIIDEVIRLIDVTGDRNMTYLWALVALELGLAVLSDLTSRGITFLDSLLGDLFTNKTSITLIEHAATLDLAQFEDATFYDKLERARRQTVTRVVLMSQVLAQVQDSVTIGFLAVGLIAFNPWLILILLIAVIPSFLGETHFNERSYSLSRSWTPERRELDYLRYIGASDETAKEIKTFNLSGFLANRFKLLSDRYYNLNKSLTIRRAIWGSGLSAIGTFAYYGAYIFILFQTVAGVITVGTLTFLAGSFNNMRGLLQGIMTRFSQIAEGALYLQDLFDFLELQPQITPPANPLPVPRPIQKGFTFENVGFKYLNSEKWAVRHLSFHLRAGEKLALVGENGAGKTTLVKLLARLYEPTEGKILLDGMDLREYDLQDLRHQVGIIFQDYVRFQMTASDNIAVGQISNIADHERIQTSARKSLADPLIQRLPDGYNQVLGKRFNQGIDLSGGEWQKVALARAYMREAQLLILDEPTSALDARAEHEVFLRFSELIKGKTAVLISHRFSTVRMADRILFLEQGQLKELGSHEELLAQNGKYAELFMLQARGYL
ncbi:ABC transporter ATP-binding protein [Pontibacter silvestris]|uniref:ABC transporter ATP-binding protein n=1 Tax=Pontibacter silvestris TaxID=2305183 RepID=A0ABW4WWL9_9BACT|nr:ABC transporter ATP-binding protein [Pontibacter silvestris]MCC9138517.1 ABC transporter ATP-binding protein/permease [Pontibacter silvestris]